MLSKFPDAYGRMPSQEDIDAVVNDFMLKVLRRMLEEYRVAEVTKWKVDFIEEVLKIIMRLLHGVYL